MAQNAPHGHQVGAAAASDDGHSAPPTTVDFSLTSAGPYGNNAGSSAANIYNMDACAGKAKNLIPDHNMEERDTAGGSKDKPRSEAEVEVAAADADADADKGKSVAAADDGERNVNIALERERRKRKKDLFRSLQDLMPHVPQKTDKVTLVEEAITYIKALEEKVAMLGKQALERQAAARGEASSSSLSLTAMPQTAQGMAALCASDVPRGWGGVPVPPAAPTVPASPLTCKTWTWPNVALTVANGNGYISVYAPGHANILTMVMSVLDNHAINVITAQISSDRGRTPLMIYAHVTGIGGENCRSSEEVYQRAVSEIKYRPHNNNN